MNGKRQKTRGSGKAGKFVLLFILLLLLAGTVALRVLQGKEPEKRSEQPAPSVAALQPDALPPAEESRPVPLPEQETEPETGTRGLSLLFRVRLELGDCPRRYRRCAGVRRAPRLRSCRPCS